MLEREIVLPPEHLFPPDEWRIMEARYSGEFAERAETVFSLSNGFVGIRGSFGGAARRWPPERSSTGSTRPGRSCMRSGRPRWPGSGRLRPGLAVTTYRAQL